MIKAVNVKRELFRILDSLPSGKISGWQLFERVHSVTGRASYPTTLLNYAREYADITGGDFKCIDYHKSIYMFTKGIIIGDALLSGIE